ncbi:MAG: XdhC family protein [Planctomycetota bacterium]
MNLFEEVVRLQGEGRDCALCTIVNTQGSTPGKSMMKLLVRDDGSFAGSVGGGCLEAEVLEAALDSMRDERPRMLDFALNERDYPDSGLICGGRLQIYVEPITEPRLYLFGGGHVSGAIARVARPCGFHITLLEDREAFACADKHPDVQDFVVGNLREAAAQLGDLERAFVVVCTRGHHDDGAILAGLHAGGARPRYLGMIGSRAKRAQLEQQLTAEGVDAHWLETVESPMGLPIGARNHEEIAVSVVAALIRARRVGPGEGADNSALADEPAREGD